MKFWISVLLAVAIAANGVAANGEKPRPTVARVSARSGNTTSYGSGVLVSAKGKKAVVLTNWHVVRSPRDNVFVRWHDGVSVPGEVIAADTVWDLAAVQVARPVSDPVTVSADAPKAGDRLTIAGYGGGEYLEQSGLLVGWLSPENPTDYRLVEVRAAARQGDSGGPIFNDRGELAGVLYGVHDGRTVGPCCTRVAEFMADVEAEK